MLSRYFPLQYVSILPKTQLRPEVAHFDLNYTLELLALIFLLLRATYLFITQLPVAYFRFRQDKHCNYRLIFSVYCQNFPIISVFYNNISSREFWRQFQLFYILVSLCNIYCVSVQLLSILCNFSYLKIFLVSFITMSIYGDRIILYGWATTATIVQRSYNHYSDGNSHNNYRYFILNSSSTW